MRRIGIDVGGTNTDAVLLDGPRVVHAVKAPTTEDVTGGIVAALSRLTRHPDIAGTQVDAIVIGTTHFINAVVQRRHLSKVAAVRIGMPASASLPPFCDWPADLAELVRAEVFMLEGGHDYDGRPFMPFDEAMMRTAAREIRATGTQSVGVASIFSPLDPAHEELAGDILAEECPGAAVTLSHRLGRIGLLERENAALLNAALAGLARNTIAGFRAAIATSGIDAPLYLTQNDGTVMSADMAMGLPVMSFASGATNSMRGAAFLSGIQDAMVVDVGGTSTDIGQLRHGFPREAKSVVEIGEVRTLFRMPDLFSLALGGGSIVLPDPLAVGPHSVGYRLTEAALVFGGRTITTTDCAVAAGIAEIGDKALAKVPPALAAAVLDRARAMIEDAVDRMKTAAGDVTLIRGRRRRVSGPRAPRRDFRGDPRPARRVRQRSRRRDRADQRRDRPGLPRPLPRGRDRRRPSPGHRPRHRSRCRPRHDHGHRARGHAARLSAGECAEGQGASGGGDGWRRIAGHHLRGLARIVAVRLGDLLRCQQSLKGQEQPSQREG
jgi:N-methylhydantoinase A/oxoprolinase/acetone carboxylase beta subunit